MANSKYYDNAAVLQVIGCTLLNPSLLEESGQYFYSEDDFVSDFHRVVFGAAFNLYQGGSTKIRVKDMETYLEKRPESYGIYKAGRGSAWLSEVLDNADPSNFEYNYNRMKKMTLFRAYEKVGIDLKFLYDPDELFDVKKKQRQENYIDSLSLNEISDIIENKILDVRAVCVDNATDEAQLIGDTVMKTLAELQEKPEFGYPLYGRYVNSLHRGARLGKFYVRSAASGVGKTRSMVADFCNVGCGEIYDLETNEWKRLSVPQATLFITTELDIQEITTMCLAFISGVNEEHILKNQYDFNERERVQRAADIISKSPLFIEEMPNFTMKEVENVIKRSIRTNKTKYIFFDYLHSSMGILQEVARASNGTRLREDNILFLFAVKLKDIAVQYNVFVLTATQLNGAWKEEKIPDQNLLRGAKAIADRCDFGSILLDVTVEDKEALQEVLKANGAGFVPNVKLSVYKNRRGSYNKMFLWMHADKSTCRFNGVFATDYDFNPIYIGEADIDFEL